MKDFKVQLTDDLWERFYRSFPGHGERTSIIRKVIRTLVILKAEEEPIHRRAAKQVFKDLKENG